MKAWSIAAVGLAASLCGCNGGGFNGSTARPAAPIITPTPSPTFTPTPTPFSTQPPATSQSVITLSASGGTYALPTAYGVGGSVTFAQNNAPAGTTVTITHTVNPNPQVSYMPEYVTLRFSNPVAFSTFGPSFTLEYPPGKPSGTYTGWLDDETTNSPVSEGGTNDACNGALYVAPGTAAYVVTPTDTYQLTLNFDAVIPSPPSTPNCPP